MHKLVYESFISMHIWKVLRCVVREKKPETEESRCWWFLGYSRIWKSVYTDTPCTCMWKKSSIFYHSGKNFMWTKLFYCAISIQNPGKFSCYL